MNFEVGQIWETRDGKRQVVIKQVKSFRETSYPLRGFRSESWDVLGYSFDPITSTGYDLVKLVGFVRVKKIKQ